MKPDDVLSFAAIVALPDPYFSIVNEHFKLFCGWHTSLSSSLIEGSRRDAVGSYHHIAAAQPLPRLKGARPQSCHNQGSHPYQLCSRKERAWETKN
ncbi:hypothetical protein I5R65_07620 [Herbaspirillum sp. AP02]|uniref:hypothetical protein n=1 Tax=unclassified Herbaspirillum TaxID=2624150 RepID=UPI0018CBCAE3|nr:hypothetical protein [Herbaspirillum sp. AP02]MBG7619328.1 hypothetical protein [Herbaspirillum sp. AP02]